MRFQFVTPKFHGVLDYLAAVALISLPFLLRLEGVGLWLSIAGGVGLILYSLLTDYQLGAIQLLPYDVHLLLDLAAAAVFLAAPTLLGFDTLTAAYYYVMGAGVLVVVAVSSRLRGQTLGSA